MDNLTNTPVEAQVEIAAALNDGATHANHPSHDFGGVDGRCFRCDCRPFGRWAPLACTV